MLQAQAFYVPAQKRMDDSIYSSPVMIPVKLSLSKNPGFKFHLNEQLWKLIKLQAPALHGAHRQLMQGFAHLLAVNGAFAGRNKYLVACNSGNLHFAKAL